MRPVPAEEIESLAIGAWILGTGGGGSPYLALLNLRQLYRRGVVCRLMAADELADDDLVAVVSNMGAPLVGQERLTDPQTMARAVTMMEEYLGRKFHAVMSLEIGGGNSIQPFLAAAMKGWMELPPPISSDMKAWNFRPRYSSIMVTARAIVWGSVSRS